MARHPLTCRWLGLASPVLRGWLLALLIALAGAPAAAFMHPSVASALEADSTPTFVEATRSWKSDAPPDAPMHPTRVAVAPDKTIWVGDPIDSRFVLFSDAGAYLGTWGEPGDGPGQIGAANLDRYTENQGPSVVFTNDGSMYLADPGNARIQKFGPDGTFVAAFDAGGTLEYPNDVAIGPDGNLYVCDNAANLIVVLDTEGNVLRSFGGYGLTDDQFVNLVGLAVAPDGTVWAADYGADSIKRFSPEGELVAVYTSGSYGTLTTPIDLAIDENGRVFVTEHVGKRVSVFSLSGEPLGWWGSTLLNIVFGSPHGIALAADGGVVVADYSLQALLKFSLEP